MLSKKDRSVYPSLCIQQVPPDVTVQTLFEFLSKLTEVIRVRDSKTNSYYFADFLTFELMEKAYNTLKDKNLHFKVYKAKNNDEIRGRLPQTISDANKTKRSPEEKENKNSNSLRTLNNSIRKVMGKCINCTLQTNEVCGRCRSTFYCSLLCQSNNWPEHRNICVGITKIFGQQIQINLQNTVVGSNCRGSNLSKPTLIDVEQKNNYNKLIQGVVQATPVNDNNVKIPDINQNLPNMKSIMPRVVPKNNECVEITHVINPSLVYIRILNDESKRILNMIKEEGKFTKPLHSIPVVGDLVLAYCAKKGYSRSIVLNISNSENITVRFLDYGFEGIVKFSELLQATVPCQYLPTFCIQLSLKNVPKTLELKQQVKSYYASFAEERKFKLKYEQQKFDQTLIGDLYDLELDDLLGNVVKALCKPLKKTFITDIEVKEIEEKVNIPLIIVENSAVNSLGAVTVVHAEDYPTFKSLETKVADGGKLIGVEPYSPELNELCFVKTGCNMWYRGKCKKIIEPNIRDIFLIDYGITVKVNISNIRFFPIDLKDPIISYECDIAGIPNDINADLGKRLMQLLGIGTTIVAKRLIKHDATNLGYIIVPSLLNTLMSEDLIA